MKPLALLLALLLQGYALAASGTIKPAEPSNCPKPKWDFDWCIKTDDKYVCGYDRKEDMK